MGYRHGEQAKRNDESGKVRGRKEDKMVKRPGGDEVLRRIWLRGGGSGSVAEEGSNRGKAEMKERLGASSRCLCLAIIIFILKDIHGRSILFECRK